MVPIFNDLEGPVFKHITFDEDTLIGGLTPNPLEERYVLTLIILSRYLFSITLRTYFSYIILLKVPIFHYLEGPIFNYTTFDEETLIVGLTLDPLEASYVFTLITL